MSAVAIVDTLLESGADEFVSGLPDEFWDTFLIIRDGEGGVLASSGYRGNNLVYRDAGDGTRDFIGYIVELRDNPWADSFFWTVSGVAQPVPGSRTKVHPLTPETYHATKEGAAKALMAVYRKYNKT